MEQMDWTVQTLLDIRILVLNKTADHSFMRLYDYHDVPLAA